VLSISLAITLFSFVGIPPLIGFFAKQMVLSAALDSGYVFLTLVAVVTSVISAYYYLNVIKQMFFDKSLYILNKDMKDNNYSGHISPVNNESVVKPFNYNVNNIKLSNYYSVTIAILTLVLLLFMFNPINLLDIVLLLGIMLMNY
jgi:NADH-ubiquinone oxidoreductase chain 2